jgi:hypothetical protein
MGTLSADTYGAYGRHVGDAAFWWTFESRQGELLAREKRSEVPTMVDNKDGDISRHSGNYIRNGPSKTKPTRALHTDSLGLLSGPWPLS